jgi:putative hydrolase of the HAD superfamily
MAKIGAVFFDIGGVLLTNGWDQAERARVLAHFSVDRAEYEMRHEPANDAWERGLIPVEEFLDRTIFFEPRSFTAADFLERMKAESKELAPGLGALGVLRRLRASACLKLAALNNEAKELNEYRIERFQLGSGFSAFFSSCYLGLRKPEPEIFLVALDVFQQPPETTVFIDDRQANCDAAECVGMHGICFQNEAQLVAELKRLGVELPPTGA